MAIYSKKPIGLLVALLVIFVTVVPVSGWSSTPIPTVQTPAITVGNAPTSIAITPDGASAYVTNYGSNTVSRINLSTDTVMYHIAVGINPVSIAISPNGEFAYVANYRDGNQSNTFVSRINLATREVGEIRHSSIIGPRFVLFSPDGSEAYVSNQNGNSIQVIRTSDDTVQHVIPVPADAQDMALSSDGGKLYVSHPSGGMVSIINLATRSVAGSITGLSQPRGLVVVSDTTQRLYVSEFGANLVSVHDVSTSSTQFIKDITGLNQPRALTLDSEEGSATQIFVTNYYGQDNIRVIDLSSDPDNIVLNPHTGLNVGDGPFAIAMSPNGGLMGYVANQLAGTVSRLSYHQPRTLAFSTTTYSRPYGSTQTLEANPSLGAGVGTLSYSHGNSTACTVNPTSGVVTMTNSIGTCSISSTITRGGATRATAFAQASTSTPVTITPGKAAITVAAASQSVSVGSSFTAAFSISSGALVSTDNISGVTFTFEGTGSTNYPASSTPPTEVGTYSVTPSSALFDVGNLSNYNITYAPGTLTIQAASSPPQSSGGSFSASPITVQLVSPNGLEVLRGNGGFVTLPQPSETRKKFVFSGWSEFRDGRGQIYKAGERLEVIRNKTLYATWRPKPSRVVASQFGPNSAVLSNAVKADVKRFLRTVPNAATVTCVGSVSSSRIGPQLRILGQARAKATCNYISDLRPKLNVRISNNVVFSLGINNRSAVLTSR
jgi:YVTN family beta-propeller protein